MASSALRNAYLLEFGGQADAIPAEMRNSIAVLRQAGELPPPAHPDLAFSPPSAPRPIRNNNPLNVVGGKYTGNLPGVAGKDAQFLQFTSPERGLAAGMSLLRSPVYANKNVGDALQTWSQKGYGGEIAHAYGIDPKTPIAALRQGDFVNLTLGMAKREGYPIDKLNMDRLSKYADELFNGQSVPTESTDQSVISPPQPSLPPLMQR